MQKDLGTAVLLSLRKYYTILQTDLTRQGIVTRKLFLESVTGSDVCSQNLLSSIADYIGARKHSVIESSKQRKKIEKNAELTPIIQRLKRKNPEGTKIVSVVWEIKAVAFYESEELSDVCKGHHNVFKVKNEIGKYDCTIMLCSSVIVNYILNNISLVL